MFISRNRQGLEKGRADEVLVAMGRLMTERRLTRARAGPQKAGRNETPNCHLESELSNKNRRKREITWRGEERREGRRQINGLGKEAKIGV